MMSFTGDGIKVLPDGRRFTGKRRWLFERSFVCPNLWLIVAFRRVAAWAASW
jgi:hypothetical protein